MTPPPTNKPHYKLRPLTAEEWKEVCAWRGTGLTGYSHHTVSRGHSEKHVDKHYYWPYGEQPSEKVLDKIAAEDPTTAAHLFCAHFLPISEGSRGSWTYTQPRRRR